jgi:tRNA nucleotidyltransferase (CCA-adding enzyme)
MARNISELFLKSLATAHLELLHLLAYQAALLRMPLYLVGGVTRDTLLGRKVKDFDLVVEGDAADFAGYLVKKYGGRILIHSKFKTATWALNDAAYTRLNISALTSATAPPSIDLITARLETYPNPGYLPTIQPAAIDDDLRRRDFTINAMAVRLDGKHFGELYDPLGGQNDLDSKTIRVLHDNSFMDDPTRIIRAARYAVRYGLELDPATRALINPDALSVLAQLSGERLRHEFDLIFEEENSAAILDRLDDLDLLTTIHPALSIADFQILNLISTPPAAEFGKFSVPEILTFRQALAWTLCLLHTTESDADAIAARLTFPAILTETVREAASLNRNLASFANAKPSQWTFQLETLSPLAVYAVYLTTNHEALRKYLTTWKNVRPHTTGDDLKARGLLPGPRFKEILSRLRAAWLDGELMSIDGELDFLRLLLTKN